MIKHTILFFSIKILQGSSRIFWQPYLFLPFCLQFLCPSCLFEAAHIFLTLPRRSVSIEGSHAELSCYVYVKMLPRGLSGLAFYLTSRIPVLLRSMKIHGMMFARQAIGMSICQLTCQDKKIASQDLPPNKVKNIIPGIN